VRFSPIIFPFLLLTKQVVSTPAPLSIEAVTIVTQYIVVPFPSNGLLARLDPRNKSLICKIDAVLLAFQAVAAKATPFCSSYLHLAASTSVVVTTPLT
jgi:hypothetical protein